MRKLIVEVDILALLDQMEAARLRHENDPPPCDYDMRLMEAYVAEWGGFTSRIDWSEELLGDPESETSKERKNRFDRIKCK